MIFVWLARLVAALGLVLGLFQIGMGFFLAYTQHPDASRYLGSSTGEAIDKGVICVVIAAALGTLSDIARQLRRKAAN